MEKSPKQNYPTAYAKHIFIVGTQIGKCPICKQTKNLLLLQFGLTLCDECLLVCMDILEQIEFGVTKNNKDASGIQHDEISKEHHLSKSRQDKQNKMPRKIRKRSK